MKKNQYIVMSLALGLPSITIGIFAIVYELIESGYISQYVGLFIVLLVLFQIFFLLIRSAMKKDE